MRKITLTTTAATTAVALSIFAFSHSAQAVKDDVKKCCNVKTGQVCKKPFPCGGSPTSQTYKDNNCSKVKAVCTDTYKKKCPCPDNG